MEDPAWGSIGPGFRSRDRMHFLAPVPEASGGTRAE